MDLKFVIVTIGAWLLFMVLAIINAVTRNEVYKPVVGDLAAHQVSSIIFMAVVFVVTYAILRISDFKN